ncbi:MAG TPA: bifunctional adenosylcobinamide kinase/adenosylcobinamide-phosphate guanylyltransferase [Rhodocyclaceae bacterium]|nr:bifunctional adenosylcobinamide kinase/adenosylcobinamide-phosphate guanylyltransferase [Rhodocyclaceae bacterium]
MSTLILGGARSGKSRYAETLATESRQKVIYIATAQPGDAEMSRRIAHHQARRPAHWQTVECELHLADTLRQHATANTCLLVDCLTLWLSNLLFAGRAAQQAEAGEAIDCALLRNEMDTLVTTLPKLPGLVILVSNEVGWGVVPANPLARVFADEQGRLNQRAAQVCDDVFLVAAGLPLQLKRTPTEQAFGP